MATFNEDASSIALVGSYLVARMPDEEGRMKDTEIDLDECIGNSNGELVWGGHHFSGGAGFLLEQSEDGPVLHATLWKDDGECVDSEIPLAERIMNDDGNLVYNAPGRESP